MSLLEHLRSSSHASVSAPTRPAVPVDFARAPEPEAPSLPPPTAAQPPEPTRSRAAVRNSEALNELKARVHEELIHELDPEQLAGDTSYTSPARRAVEQAAEERIGQIDGTLGRQER